MVSHGHYGAVNRVTLVRIICPIAATVGIGVDDNWDHLVKFVQLRGGYHLDKVGVSAMAEIGGNVVRRHERIVTIMYI